MHQFAPSLFCTVLCRCVLESRRAAGPCRAPQSRSYLCFHLSVNLWLSLCLCRWAELALLWSLSCSFAAWVLGSSLCCCCLSQRSLCGARQRELDLRFCL